MKRHLLKLVKVCSINVTDISLLSIIITSSNIFLFNMEALRMLSNWDPSLVPSC